MTTSARLERDLPTILSDLAMGPEPDYVDDVFGRTGRMRQRPAWTFPERWFPMADIASRPAFLPRTPWRALVGALIIIAMLAAVALVVVGSRTPLPAPYGVAKNGLIAFSLGGDIYIGDPARGTSHAIITGPSVDRDPWFSFDGTRIMFLRGRAQTSEDLVVADADGSHFRTLTTEPLVDRTGWEWSGDGRSILVTSSIGGRQTMSIVDVDSGAIRVLDLNLDVRDAFFRPPTGGQIVFVGVGADGEAMYLTDRNGADPRLLVRAVRGVSPPQWSPDGSTIAYSDFDPGAERMQVHVFDVTKNVDRVLPNPAGVAYQGGPQWSPDGTQLLVGRGFVRGGPVRLAVIPVDEIGRGTEIGPPQYDDWAGWGWSPDGKSVLLGFEDPAVQTLVIDLEDGESRPIGFPGWLSWQRLAP